MMIKIGFACFHVLPPGLGSLVLSIYIDRGHNEILPRPEYHNVVEMFQTTQVVCLLEMPLRYGGKRRLRK